MKLFLIALQFLTILPIRLSNISIEELSRSFRWYPLVGVVIGLITIVFHRVFFPFLPQDILTLLTLILLIFITGGLHLDGFADMLDGFYAGKNRENILQIMKDSHVGSVAVLGLICLILSKFVLLNNLSSSLLYPTILVMLTLGRWSIVIAAMLYPYAGKQGLGKSFIENLDRKEWIWATSIALLVSIALLQLQGLIIMILTFGVIIVLSQFIKKKIGGITGDTLGATVEIVEIVILLMLNIISYNQWI